MKNILILTILLLVAYLQIYSQECAVEVKLKPQKDIEYLATEDAEIKKLSQKYGIKFTQSYPNFKTTEVLLFYTLRWQGKEKKENIINDFMATGKFEKEIFEFEPAYLLSCSNPVSVNDPHFLNSNSWPLDMIEAPCAWRLTTGNLNVIIGIADTEFEKSTSAGTGTHEDLVNKIPYIYGTAPSLFPHGTSVASIAAGWTNNGKGIASVGYNCMISAYRIPHWINNQGQGTYNSTDMRDAILYLYNHQVHLYHKHQLSM